MKLSAEFSKVWILNEKKNYFLDSIKNVHGSLLWPFFFFFLVSIEKQKNKCVWGPKVIRLDQVDDSEVTPIDTWDPDNICDLVRVYWIL